MDFDLFDDLEDEPPKVKSVPDDCAPEEAWECLGLNECVKQGDLDGILYHFENSRKTYIPFGQRPSGYREITIRLILDLIKILCPPNQNELLTYFLELKKEEENSRRFHGAYVMPPFQYPHH